MFKALYYGTLLLLVMMRLAYGQAPTTLPVTLAWDYTTQVDGFDLERKTGQQGAYALVPVSIPGAARVATDTTALIGQIYCWRLYAKLQTYRSAPSNEVCSAAIAAPLNLRIQ